MGKGKRVGEWNEWGERPRLEQSDGEQCPKSMSCEEEDRDACGQNGADSKFCSKGLQTIRYTPGNRAAYQSQCSSPAKDEPEFLGPKPAPRKKGRQEGRGTSKRTEERGVQQYKSKQDGTLYCHGCAVLARVRHAGFVSSTMPANPNSAKIKNVLRHGLRHVSSWWIVVIAWMLALWC